MITRINVNIHAIRKNAKHGTRDPVVRVQRGSKKPEYGYRVKINGPSEVVYSPDKPLKCGAKVWIETTSDVVLDTVPMVQGQHLYGPGGIFKDAEEAKSYAEYAEGFMGFYP